MAFRLYWPTTTPNITQPFGVNWTGVPDFYTRFGLPGHEGLDFQAGDGAEVHAAADGVISRISLDGDTDPDHLPYGNQIRIAHHTNEGEFETVYAHLQKVANGLQKGSRVQAGDLIAFADHTGNVNPRGPRGAHLHFMLKKQGSSRAGQTSFPRDIMDPTPFLEAFGVKPPTPAATPAEARLVASPALTGSVALPPPSVPQAFNNRYRLQTDELQFRRAWTWASGGSGNQRWLNLIATPNAPYSSPDQRKAFEDIQYVNNAITYLNPDNDPKGTPRYWPNAATFCNIFVNDATRILCCEIPNNPANSSVGQMLVWLTANGIAAGWSRTDDGKKAQDFVNQGHVAIMIWSDKKRSDHVALVRPGQGVTKKGFYWPRVAQAGSIVSADLNSNDSFGSLPLDKLSFFLHD